jgi:S-formylglutathione hydrolase
MKAHALRHAAELGLVLVAPDTSPRGLGLPGEEDGWDFGTGAGFYLDAEAEPWKRNYRLYSYVTKELPALIAASFPVETGRCGVFGHSMGGHGALVAALKNPQAYRSVSAFAPICNPVAVPWGEKAFGNYLGADRARWSAWDASELLKQGSRFPGPILVDQGMKDQFLAAQLRPDALQAAAKGAGQELVLRRHEGYDHSYWFIQTFIEDHLKWHAERLCV